MICQTCGKEVPDNTVFCPACGVSISLTNSEPQKDLYKTPITLGWIGNAITYVCLPIIFFTIWGAVSLIASAVTGTIGAVIFRKNPKAASILLIVSGGLSLLCFIFCLPIASGVLYLIGGIKGLGSLKNSQS